MRYGNFKFVQINMKHLLYGKTELGQGIPAPACSANNNDKDQLVSQHI